mgnify:CR=1 FL=1
MELFAGFGYGYQTVRIDDRAECRNVVGGSDEIIGVGFDKSDAILNLIDDGYLLCTMAQNPDVMGSEGVKAAVKAINGEELGGEVTDTGVSVITKDSDK